LKRSPETTAQLSFKTLLKSTGLQKIQSPSSAAKTQKSLWQRKTSHGICHIHVSE